jgi:tetratricopeptide (TPR) repeat protein
MKSCLIHCCLILILCGQTAFPAETTTDVNALPLLQQSILLLKEGKKKDALISFEKCLDYKLSAQHEAVVRIYLANLCHESDRDKAFEHLKQAHELDPKNHSMLPALGSEYAYRKDYASARECWNTFLQSDPNGSNADLVRKSLDQLDKTEKDREFIDKLNKAINFCNAKKYAEAAAILEETQKTEHGHKKKEQEMLGMCYAAMGKYRESIKIFQNLLQEDPKQPKVVSALAGAYEGLGDLKSARDCLKKYLHMEHGGEIAQAAKDRIPTLKKVIKTSGDSEATDYFQAVSTPFISRWSMTRMPLRVYFAPTNEVRNYQQSYDTAIPRALDLWCKAIEGRLSWKTVNEQRNADIEVVFTADPADVGKSESQSEAGVCQTRVLRKKGAKISAIDGCVVKILTTDHDGNPFSQDALEATAAHEIGHALGMKQHSSNANDVMFFSATKTVKNGLTERDINTIKCIYNAVVYEDGRIEVPGREETK